MSDTEQRYSQIEKEALSIVWSCEKFTDFVLGKHILLGTDHKPLVPLFSTTHLDRMPPWILGFRLWLSRFDYDIEHVPGKLLYTVDTLSRAPTAPASPSEGEDTEEFVSALVARLPASKDRLEVYRKAQEADSVCSQLMHFCKQGWPSKHQIKGDLSRYWAV